VLSATGTTAGTVTYNVTATTPAGCTSTIAPIVITVNPNPNVSATPTSATICSGATTGIVLTSNVSGTTFTWTVSQTGASGATAGTGSTIGQVLTATGTTAGSVIYTITPSASGCASGSPVSVTITVNPLPTATATPSTQSICDGAATGISMTSDLGATTFDWTVSQTNVTGGAAGSGTSISQLLDLTSVTTAGSAVYTITPTDNGCAGTPITVTVNVNPIDNPAFSYSSSTYCQTGTDPSATITGTPGGVFSVTPSTGLVIDTLTGLIDLSASTLGSYNITYQTNGICASNSIVAITITTAPSALFGYAANVCSSDPNPTPTFGPGASAGVFTASPSGLVFVDSLTGEVDLTGSIAGTYTITNSIASGGGCASASATGTITISQAATVNAGLNDTICELGTMTLTGIMGGSATSVVWSTNGTGTFNDTTLLSPVYTPSAADVAAGTVVLTVTTNDPAGGCNAATDFAVLNITPLDSATFTYSGGTFCQSGTDPIPTITGVAGGVFTAAPAGISFISTSTGEIDLSASALGTYTVVYTTNGPCPSTDTAIVTITTAPVATFSFTSGATSFCQSDNNPTPVFAPGASAGTFTVTPAGLVFVSPTSGQVDLANSTPGTYTLINNIVAAGGCAAAVDSLTITINVPATVNAGTDAAVCAGATYTASGTIGGSAASSTWTTNGSGTFDNAALPNATYTPSAADAASGVVMLYLTTDDPSGVCNAVQDSMMLTITPLPQAPVVTNPAPYCAGSTIGAITFPALGGTVNWYSDAALTTSVGSGNPFTPAGITSTTTLWVTESVGACTSFASQVTITFNPLPVVDSTTAVLTGATCGDSTGAITNVTIVSGQSPFSYLWQDASGNNVGDSLNLANVGPGVYTLTITDSNGCVTTTGGGSAFNVTSTSGVTASFTATPPTGEKPLPVAFTNTSIGGVSYLWQFPNGSTDTSFNSMFTFTQLGSNSVCLIADNGVGCVDTACTTIDVFINSVFVIPNVFTPNGDNVNDIFTVKNVGLETMDAEIYNRWGQKEYEWHTTNGGWDGRTAAGVLVPDGTYFFIISAKGIDGKEYFEKGSFELIR
jgi:gliding motility-associated-like protein